MKILENKTFDEKYCYGNDYGERIFWNISNMRKNIEENNIPIKSYSINELFEKNPSTINKKYAMEINHKKLGIIVELIKNNENSLKLIDGNHQLYKAKIMGEKTFDCYYFSYEEQIRFIVDINNKSIPVEIYDNFIKNTIENI
jgi:hypothetical protein